MQNAPDSAWKRMALVGAVGMVALIGNMRASGLQDPPETDKVAAARAQTRAQNTASEAVRRQPGARSRGRVDAGDRPDEVQLVPAIYAWDPDVRFIYYRQISKWM